MVDRSGSPGHDRYMSVAKQTQKCPFCLEPMLAGATRCKHCQADLTEIAKKKSRLAGHDTFRHGFLTGILFSLLLALLLYAHFYWGQ